MADYSSWLLERLAIGEVLRLRLGTTTIGRQQSSTIRLQSHYVSGNHAELVISNDDTRVTIKDLKSTNGIYVNETLYKQSVADLRAGDRIGIGVTIENEDDVDHPIYLLKYLPIRAPISVVPNADTLLTKGITAAGVQAPAPEIKNLNIASTFIKKEPVRSVTFTPIEPFDPRKSPIAFITLSDDEEDNKVDNNKSLVVGRSISFTDNSDELPKISAVIANISGEPLQTIPPPSPPSMNKNSSTTNNNSTSNNKSTSNTNSIVEQHISNKLTTLLPSENPIAHCPIGTSLKQERVSNVSADIKSIFGETDDVILDKIKDIDPYVYNNLNGKPIQMTNTIQLKPLFNGALISLCSEDEDDEDVNNEDCCENLGQLLMLDEEENYIAPSSSSKKNAQSAKSPNIFDCSLNSSKDKNENVQLQEEITTTNDTTSTVKNKEKDVEQPNNGIINSSEVTQKKDTKISEEVVTNITEVLRSRAKRLSATIDTDAEDFNSYEPRSDDEDVEELMFSQVIIDDMKAEMANDNDNYNNIENDSYQLAPYIKVEPINISYSEAQILPDNTKEKQSPLELSSWIISDDEQDEELETRVSDWKTKLFSQSFSAMSQIYEDNIDYDLEHKSDKDEDEETDDEDDKDSDLYDRAFADPDKLISELCETFEEEIKDKVNVEAKQIAVVVDDLDSNNIKRRSGRKNSVDSNLEDQQETTKKDLKSCESPLIKRRSRVTRRVHSLSDEEQQKEEHSTNKLIKLINKTLSDNKGTNKKLHTDQKVSSKSALSSSSSTQGKKPIKSQRLDKLVEKDEQNVEIPSKRTKTLSDKDKTKQSTPNDQPRSSTSKHIIERLEQPEKTSNEEIQDRRKSHENININSIDTEISAQPKKPNVSATLSSEKKVESSKTKRGPPQLIDAPQLPRHKGKHRGVSAARKPCPNMRHGDKSHVSNQNWKEKSNETRKRNKEEHRKLMEKRQENLKKIAIKEKENKKEPLNRKANYENKANKPKIKITATNRGAFLTEEIQNDNANKSYKIPKIKSNKESDSTLKPKESSSSSSSLSYKSSVLDGPSTSAAASSANMCASISMSTSKTDSAVDFQAKSNYLKRQSSTEHSIGEVQHKRKKSVDTNDSKPQSTVTMPACRAEAMAARANRTTNKVTFASMQKNFIESHQYQKKLDLIENMRSCLRNTNTNEHCKEVTPRRPKKTVRFNDTPIVYYVDSVKGAQKKVNKKDVVPRSSYQDRLSEVRRTYRLVDFTDKIISLILRWSNAWLRNRNAAANEASETIFPMSNYFNSFENYMNIIFPLMKLEFISGLEREYNVRKSAKFFRVVLEAVCLNNNDRLILHTKFYGQKWDGSKCDLVILDFDNKQSSTFAYMSNNRKNSDSSYNMTFEILTKDFSKDMFNSLLKKEINVRPAVDNLRVEFGAFNAVYQLAETPLFRKILNPLELLKNKRPPQAKKKYKGFDKLNDLQKEVILNTYTKIIDESTPSITLIKGPPGTGKSCLITNLVLQTLYGDEVRRLDKKILICAQSNGAVDVITAKLNYIRQRMSQTNMFRLVRYGILDKISEIVQAVSLQKLVEHEQLRKLQSYNKNIQIENKENMRNQMLELESQIAEMKSRNIRGTVQEDELIEIQRQLQLMRNIMTQTLRPEDERSLFTCFLKNANIVCATLSSCVKLEQYVNYFDICIIDEATQCTEPYTLLPLRFGINSLVLVGDTQQLPATVLSKKAKDYGLGTSLFTRIQRCLDTVVPSNNSNSVTPSTGVVYGLKTQYRMHPEICSWPNAYFYKNELLNGERTLKFKTAIMPFSILNLTYKQNDNCSQGKIVNNDEADFVVKLLKALDGHIPNKYNSYGVITPYAYQRKTLENSIKSSGITNIMVNTIDSYQGLEKDVIIISNARTRGIGFLANYQRLNVALTRPRKCLILCGNFKNLESVPAWRSLLNNARQRKLFHEISAESVEDIQRNVIDKIKVQTS